MRISDARPGDVLRSNGGAVWVRLNHGAAIALVRLRALQLVSDAPAELALEAP